MRIYARGAEIIHQYRPAFARRSLRQQAANQRGLAGAGGAHDQVHCDARWHQRIIGRAAIRLQSSYHKKMN
jgi:single-stranded DNA-specific DHH superfamily exonuclease